MILIRCVDNKKNVAFSYQCRIENITIRDEKIATKTKLNPTIQDI